MNTSHTASKTLSVIAFAAVTAAILVMALAPQGSIFAG